MYKSLLTITLLMSSVSAFAETSEQYVHRSEFFFCNFNEGKTYNDLLAEQAPYEDFLKENDLQYNRINLTPIWDNDQEYDYVMWGNWPTGQDQYIEWGAYMNDYPEWAEKNGVSAQVAGECKSTSSMRFHSVLRVRIPMEERDERLFTDWRTCKLTDDADISELKALYAKQEKLARDFGLKGWGVSFFTPYRGIQEEPDWDFIMMTHWYNAESRANMISSYRDYTTLLRDSGVYEERSKHIESCSGANTYQAHMVYNTHNVVYDTDK
jgi:hypothetical protein|tara:strand:+ start:233 stop:1033 length:801 start_codon:yes stop_codon:yes gene_type:complete